MTRVVAAPERVVHAPAGGPSQNLGALCFSSPRSDCPVSANIPAIAKNRWMANTRAAAITAAIAAAEGGCGTSGSTSGSGMGRENTTVYKATDLSAWVDPLDPSKVEIYSFCQP